MKEHVDSLVVAPSRSDNSLGRATSLALALREIGEVRIIAYDDGPLWQGARDSESTVASFHSSGDIRAEIARHRPRAVVAVKPFRTSLEWAERALRTSRVGAAGPLLIADFDDLDVAIHAAWHRGLPIARRIASLVYSDLSPIRIQGRIRWLLPRADAMMVSSWALRGRLPAFKGPEIRVPHPRAAPPYQRPTAAERLRIGFLGTPLGYKGIDAIVELVAARADAELHVLAGTERAFERIGAERLVVHPHRGPDTLALAFQEIDVVVLPQNPDMSASRFQLPAKLIDAIRFGRPVVATDTPAIRELAGPSVVLVDSWSDLTRGLSALDTLADREHRERLGREGALAWARTHSAEQLGCQLRLLLTSLG